MTRVCFRGEWFESVASAALFEADYEALLVQESSNLFPSYHLVEFKAPVEAAGVTGKPDLALIEKDLGAWWVVEVELGHHPLHQHVLPQVEVFSAGRYGSEHARYLADRLSAEYLPKLEEMMLGAQPRVLVIVNEPRVRWEADIRRLGGRLGVVEVLRSPRNQIALRANGDQLPEPRRVLSECRSDPTIPRLLRVDSPAALPPDDTLSIAIEKGITTWTKVVSGDAVYLAPSGPSPVSPGRFNLDRLDDGRLVLRRRGGNR